MRVILYFIFKNKSYKEIPKLNYILIQIILLEKVNKKKKKLLMEIEHLKAKLKSIMFY